MISASYPGRIELSKEGARTWQKLLVDVDDRCLEAAVADLCATENWPPSIAAVRARALELQAGELAPVSAYEAWARVRESLHDDNVVLSQIEKEAKRQIGGSWQIKNDTSGMSMNHFVKAYDALVSKQRRLRTATPAAKQIAALNAPALPAPSRQLPPMATTTAGPDEVRKMLQNVAGYRPLREMD